MVLARRYSGFWEYLIEKFSNLNIFVVVRDRYRDFDVTYIILETYR